MLQLADLLPAAHTRQDPFKGRDITGMKPAMVARLGLVRSFQISAVFPHLTALENVRLALQRARGASFDFWRSESVLKVFDDRAHQLLFDVGLSRSPKPWLPNCPTA